ncbi:hypothetical protein ACUXZZ_02435 [Streptomyces graminifolii]|uniref:hypothetical protein n=1 Tax=Streptomyces graminifolii TaxID=1266771 RepID=UPI0040587239
MSRLLASWVELRMGWAADQRDGETPAKLYEADAVVEIHYHRGPDRPELLGTLSGGAEIAAAMSSAMAPHPPPGLEPPHHLRPPGLRRR